ncbi:gene transfer agent family protein [Paroceanicella profunda]|uniref:Gene transfer agent family protein n=1 Tax=Paroceanicella profunda TaxID=2579971 RepID=A0A5B8G1J0_9RHOB|nr:gene transfer agent family protein [Paroceanicella profunda]QDL93079.1 gene transfer agent family protein [Paroceanicella profunda]
MANPWRGEVELVLDDTTHAMRLTLGALAELEARLDSGSIVELVERFEKGEVRARDLLALLTAGLRGGGLDINEASLGACEIGGGPVGAARAAAELLRLTFALPQGNG